MKHVSFPLETNKSSGYDEISFKVVKKCFGKLYNLLRFVFEWSLRKVIFPNQLKIAVVTSVFKGDDHSKLGKYRPMSVLQSFSKILQHIMYNFFYKYLLENKIIYSKQFGFQVGHSNDHAIIQFVNQILDTFENNLYTLNLSKTFDIVNHTILLKSSNYLIIEATTTIG